VLITKGVWSLVGLRRGGVVTFLGGSGASLYVYGRAARHLEQSLAEENTTAESSAGPNSR
jgi:hypothetical protein